MKTIFDGLNGNILNKVDKIRKTWYYFGRLKTEISSIGIIIQKILL